MSKIKKKNFIFVSLLLAIVCGLAYCLPTFINSKHKEVIVHFLFAS